MQKLLNPSEKQHTAYELAGLCFLLIVLSLQLFLSVRRQSQTWDEANHIFCGYRTWTHGDFGLNPEHPPLVKLLATAPLLWSQWRTPVLEERFFKEDAFLRGKEFLYQNDPEKILSRTRTAAATLTLLTALVVFFATREMFERGAAFFALTLLAFDPNILAHGALITTDVGFACFMLLSVYMFYRFVKSPSALRLFQSRPQVLRLGGAHHVDRLGGLMVVLQISLRRTATRSATESAVGGVC